MMHLSPFDHWLAASGNGEALARAAGTAGTSQAVAGGTGARVV